MQYAIPLSKLEVLPSFKSRTINYFFRAHQGKIVASLRTLDFQLFRMFTVIVVDYCIIIFCSFFFYGWCSNAVDPFTDCTMEAVVSFYDCFVKRNISIILSHTVGNIAIVAEYYITLSALLTVLCCSCLVPSSLVPLHCLGGGSATGYTHGS